jgi:hypothetical protein
MLKEGRPGLTEEQKADMWRRWKAGYSIHDICQALKRNSSPVHQQLAIRGGIAPPGRIRTVVLIPERAAGLPVLRAFSFVYMLPPLPRRSDWVPTLLNPPAVSTFPERVTGSVCASTFSRLARRSLALRPAHSRCHQFVTCIIPKASTVFVTSTVAPVASGWSICRVGLSPTGKRRLFTAHTLCRQS